MKTCSKCKGSKEITEFEFIPKRERYQSWCRECRKEYSREYYLKNKETHKLRMKAVRAKKPEYYKDYNRRDHFQRRYGLSIEDIEQAKKAQNYTCPICSRRVDNLVVDHDHMTKRVRGFLCNSCNQALGVLGDSIEGIEKARKYLMT